MWPFRSKEDRIDEAAALWFSRMHGPDRERYRDAFQAWFGADPDHARAYQEAAEIFDSASVLRQGEVARGRRGFPSPARPRLRLGYALAAAFVLVALFSVLFLSGARIGMPGRPGPSSAQYATAAGETRQIDLPDGSHMTLWASSAVDVAFNGQERRITLRSGHGRFAVAHEARPFRVVTGDAEVVAHGTLFDVSVSAGRTRVALIEGSVDVSYLAPLPGNGERRVRRLQPGQQLVVGGLRAPQSSPEPTPAPADRAPVAMLQFDETPLAEAVAQSNRHGGTIIRLADPSIGELHVTGAFRASDSEGLAEALAAAFHLRIERLPDETLVLHSNSVRPGP